MQCKRAACANSLLLRLLFVLPRFTAPRRLTKQLNPNPKHLDHMYDLDANPCDGATQRAE
jgi:hypothetical protein